MKKLQFLVFAVLLIFSTFFVEKAAAVSFSRGAAGFDSDFPASQKSIAQYNFIPDGETLPDVSGNGNDGTISGATVVPDGLSFDGVDDFVEVGSGNFAASGVQFRFKSGTSNHRECLLSGVFDDYIIYLGSTGKIGSGMATVANVATNGTYDDGLWHSVQMVKNGTNDYSIWVDGVDDSGGTDSGYRLTNYKYIGKSSPNLPFSGEMADVRVYDYVLTAAQAADYHNSFQKNAQIDAGNSNKWHVGSLLKGLVAQYPLDEKNQQSDDRVLTNSSAGTSYVRSEDAYGEWEFNVNKGADGNIVYVPIISDRIDAVNFDYIGYVFGVFDEEQLFFSKRNDGTSNSLIVTATSYVDINTDYRIKVARLKSEGVFKDIPTLQLGDLINNPYSPNSYTSFTSNGRYGFNAVSDGSAIQVCGTADELVLTNTYKYLVEFDLKLNNGVAPVFAFAPAQGSTPNSNGKVSVNGRNSAVLTVTSTVTGVLEFYNGSTVTDYEVSGLTIRRIYDADTFATFIRGGNFGSSYTLVDTTGGSGTNPVTDSTYTTSNFFVTDLDAGDTISKVRTSSGFIPVSEFKDGTGATSFDALDVTEKTPQRNHGAASSTAFARSKGSFIGKFDGQDFGDNVLGTFDFTSGWGGANWSADSADTFTITSGGYGPTKSVFTTGKKYRVKIMGTTTATGGIKFVNNSGGPTPLIAETTTSGNFTIEGNILASTIFLYLRGSSVGTTTIQSFEIFELTPDTLIDYSSAGGKSEDRQVGEVWGDQKISNSTFETSTGWTLGTDWAVSGGGATLDTTSAYRYLTSNVTLTAGKKYRLIYDITSYTVGSLSVADGSLISDTAASTVGHHVIDFTSGNTGTFKLGNTQATTNLSIDNVYLYERRPDLVETDVTQIIDGNHTAAEFNGTTSKIDLGADVIGTKTVTAMGWVKAYSTGENNAGVIIGDGKFYIRTTGNLAATSNNFTRLLTSRLSSNNLQTCSNTARFRITKSKKY